MSCREENCEELVHKHGRCLTHHRAYHAEKMRLWRMNNPEKARANDKRYRERNPEAALARSLRWHYANKEHLRAYNAEYAKKNKEYKTFKASTRRARQAGAQATAVLRKEIKRLYSSPCFYCESTQDITVDHLIPIGRGGSHSIGNLVSACRSCNVRKGNKLPIEYRIWCERVLALATAQ